MIGPTGSIRCGSTSRSCFNGQASRLSRKESAQAEMPVLLGEAEFFEHVAALCYDLLVIDPDVAAAR